MIGDRIRQARKAAALTLGGVVERLEQVGESITKAGLSKYELGKSVPKASFLKSLGDVLEVSPQYFLQEPRADVTWRLFRKKSRLSRSKQDSIKARVLDIVERQLWLEDALLQKIKVDLPQRRAANTLEEAEELAQECRVHWKLGNLPIDSLASFLEFKGFMVVAVQDEDVQFDGLSGWLELCPQRPLIVVNTAVPDDRVRYNLAHELGHLILGDDSLPEEEEEKFAHRFAAAFIAPTEAVFRELGCKRRQLLFDELGLLKAKYGLSMQAWIRRAKDLEIIPESHYRALFREFSKRGWRKSEPYIYEGFETPTFYEQLYWRALAESVIAGGSEYPLLPEGVSGRRISEARRILGMPKHKRNSLLEELAEQAANLYGEEEMRGLEGLGVHDFYEYTDQG